MAELKVLLLGTPVILHGEHSVQIPRRTHRALLYYLAAQGRAVGRAELLPLFWEDESDADARARLRDALAKLRQQLPSPDLLIATVDQVGLDFSRVWVDMLEFERLVQEMGRIPWRFSANQPLPEAIYHALQQAVALWRGSQFLSGANLPESLALDAWYTNAASALSHQRQLAMERLCDHELARGDLEASLGWARQVVAVDEINDEYHARVLEILLALGRQAEALRYCSMLEELYDRELGAALPQVLRDLCAKLQSPLEPVQPEPVPWSLPPGLELPYSGEPSSLDTIQRAFQRGGVLLLEGEAGCGKTRLLREFYQSLQPAPRLMSAFPQPASTSLPYQMLIEMLRRSVAPEEWIALPEAWQRQLALLLPELSALASATGEAEMPASKTQVFEAFHQLFVLLAKKARLLVVLDNAQWADEASLDVIAHLVNRGIFNRSTGLLVIACRGAEVSAHLERLLATLRGAPSFYELHIAPLTEDAVTQLIAAFLGKIPSPEFARRLAQESGGNPLYISEILTLLLDLNISPDSERNAAILPAAASLHTLVRERLRRLDSTSQQLLGAAAVLGSPFDLPTLQQVARLEDDSFLTALETLEQVKFLQALPGTDAAPIEYAFTHEKICEAVLLEMTAARKNMLHYRAAQTLETRLGKEARRQAAVLARHYESASAPVQAFDWWLEAAKHAHQLFATADEQFALSRAEQILQRNLGKISDVQVYQLYRAWGSSAMERNDLPQLQKAAAAMQALGEQRSSGLLLGAALSKQALYWILQNRNSEAAGLIERTIAYLEVCSERLPLVEAYTRRGVILTNLLRLEEAEASYRQAIQLGEHIAGDDFRLAVQEAQVDLAALKVLSGFPAEGMNYARQALQNAVLLRNAYRQIDALNYLGIISLYTGQMELARQYCEEGLRLAQRNRLSSQECFFHFTLSKYYLYAGKIDACLEQIELTRTLARETGQQLFWTGSYTVEGDLYTMLMNHRRAAEVYQQGMPEQKNSPEYAEIWQRVAIHRALSERTVEGEGELQQVIQFTRQANAMHVYLPALFGSGIAAVARGEMRRAQPIFEEVRREATVRSYEMIRLMVEHVYVLKDVMEGDFDSALAQLELLLSFPATKSSPWMELYNLALTQFIYHQRAQTLPGGVAQRIEDLLTQLESSTTRAEILAELARERQIFNGDQFITRMMVGVLS